MSRVRPVGGRPTRTQCGWRWPRMTTCCAVRSRRTVVGCSSTQVTGCAPRSRRRSRAVDAAVAAQRALQLPVRMGLGDRRSRAARGGLLRCGAEPRGAGDGRGARRTDPAGRVRRRVCSAESIFSIWGRGGCGTCQPRWGCFRSERRACARTFPPLRALDSSPGNLRPAGHQLHRAGVRGRGDAKRRCELIGW